MGFFKTFLKHSTTICTYNTIFIYIYIYIIVMMLFYFFIIFIACLYVINPLFLRLLLVKEQCQDTLYRF